MNKVFFLTSLFLFFILLFSCKNQKAVSKASIDFNFMDTVVAPKDNFYLYANGKWLEKTDIPDIVPGISKLSEISFNQIEEFKQMLDSLSAIKFKQGSDRQKLSDYYYSAINIDRRNQLGLDPISQILDEIDAVKSLKELTFQIAKQHDRANQFFLFQFIVRQDIKTQNEYKYHLSQQGLTLSSNYYLDKQKEEILNKFQNHLKLTFEMFGYDSSEAEIAAISVIKIERELSMKLMGNVSKRNSINTYNKMSLSDIQQKFNSFDWNTYLETRKIKDIDSIIVDNPDFFENLNTIYQEFNIETWKNYMKWLLFHEWSKFLDENSRQHQFDFFGKIIYGVKEKGDIKLNAIRSINNSAISELLGKELIKKNFNTSSKKKVAKIVDHIIEAYSIRIQNLDWMSQETKIEALNKLNSISVNIGHPSSWNNYSTLKIDRNEYFRNRMNMSIFFINENKKKIAQKVNNTSSFKPQDVNAYYQASANTINLPAGILVSPVFNENFEDAVNYGRIGAIIGHEITHGFDDDGSRFDADGSLNNWWKDEDKKEFKKRYEILGETFSKFCPFENSCVNPKLTMGENIADLGGLIIAYKAYQMTDEYKSGVTINGFSPAQRFFIAYAQLWAAKCTDKELKRSLLVNKHSPEMYRVNGTLKNFPEFFDVFLIPEDSEMRNSKDKIPVIW